MRDDNDSVLAERILHYQTYAGISNPDLVEAIVDQLLDSRAADSLGLDQYDCSVRELIKKLYIALQENIEESISENDKNNIAIKRQTTFIELVKLLAPIIRRIMDNNVIKSEVRDNFLSLNILVYLECMKEKFRLCMDMSENHDKTDIVPMEAMLICLNKLKMYEYRYNDEDSGSVELYNGLDKMDEIVFEYCENVDLSLQDTIKGVLSFCYNKVKKTWWVLVQPVNDYISDFNSNWLCMIATIIYPLYLIAV